MNRKGFLLAEETLKIVIALICIGFLIYLLTSLYFKNKESKELELAKASLEHLISEINSGVTVVEIYNPGPSFNVWGILIGYWKITSWSSVDEMPNQCSNLNWNNCLCICNNDWGPNEREECDRNGICLESEAVVKEDIIKIDKIPFNLEIKDNIIIEK